jgi:hypothetical protein
MLKEDLAALPGARVRQSWERLRPHLLRNQWNEFTPDSEKRAKLEEGLKRGLSVYEAALGAGYSDRHARRLAWWV